MPLIGMEKSCSLPPPNFISHNHTRRNRNSGAIIGGEVGSRDPPLDGNIDCRFRSVVSLYKSDNRPVWHRIASAIAQRLGLQLAPRARSGGTHPQIAGFT